jgi:hypothetical protein
MRDLSLKTLNARARLIGLVLALGTAACASGTLPSPPAGPPQAQAVPAFSFAADTFAFRNDVWARNPDAENLYAHYCFVLARTLRQFFAFARFDPAAPRLDYDGYVSRVRDVVARPPWAPVPPLDDRILIPGYPNLRAFSSGEEQAVKAALGTRFWTWVHWTNWRVVFPVTRGHQEAVANEIQDGVRRGSLVQLLVTNWPKPELNHTVVAYAFRDERDAIEFAVWDPNDPWTPGRITFDRAQGRFVATHLFDTQGGVIRVFRMYYSAWL